MSLITFINTNTHTLTGGVPIVWRNIYTKNRTLTCWLLRIAEDTLLFLFCYERDFMMSLSDDKQADVIDAFNTLLPDIWTIF